MPGLRSILGPLIVGVAVWCAAGRVTVSDYESATVRLAVPAPIWIMMAGFVAALCVGPWRRRPLLTTPALLSTLPWWPVPLPPIALVWTGALAWAPIAAAVIATWAAARVHPVETHVVALPGPLKHAMAATLLSLLAGVAVAWAIAPRVPGGDEPHYLVITQSLIADGDLRIQNNHDRRDYAAYFSGTLAPDTRVRGQDGQQYSIHAPGVSVLVLPAFWLVGYRGAQATMLIAAALAGGLVWWIGWLVSGRVGAAWFSWAAVAGSTTFLLQSVTIYPDGPGALATALACWLLLRLSMRGTHVGIVPLVLVSMLLAALPWLHTRFAVLAVGFGAAIAWGLVREPLPIAARLRRLVSFLVLPVVSAVGWLLFFQLVYGTPDPRAPYGPMDDASWAFVPGGVAGLLFDQQFGLLAYTPVLLAMVALPGARPLGPLRGPVLWPLIIGAIYLASVASVWMWWAGRPATPARFVNAVLPVLAAPLALVFARGSHAARAVWTGLLATGLAIAGCTIAVGRGALAWNDRDAQARWLEWLSPVVDLPRGWPSFFWTLDPARLQSEIPFLIHAAMFLAAALLAVGISVRLARTPGRRGVIAAWIGALMLMTAVQAGWILNGVSGLDPARSQLAVLEQVRHGRPLFRLSGFAVRPAGEGAEQMRIRSEARGRVDAAAPWLVLNGVPPGVYELTIVLGQDKPGSISVLVGNHVFRTMALGPGSRHQMRLPLPAGARTLSVVPGPDLARITTETEIIPVSLRATPRETARGAMRSDGSAVFFLDDNVFAEETGFWTRGDQTASFVFATDPGRPAIALNLRNGPFPNVVTVQAGALTVPETLQPSESRTVTVPVDPEGVVTISLTASRGFRPSEESGSNDRRYLGVWVEIK